MRIQTEVSGNGCVAKCYKENKRERENKKRRNMRS
jgi:hypothetical protein